METVKELSMKYIFDEKFAITSDSNIDLLSPVLLNNYLMRTI